MSRKLLTIIAAIAGILGVVALGAFRVVDPQIGALAIVAIAGLGGYNVREQAKLDANGGGS